MNTFLGMVVEQDNNTIKLHLDHYVHEMLTEYKNYILMWQACVKGILGKTFKPS